MTEVWVLLGIGLAGGLLSGLVGLGGGVVLIPGLIFFVGLTQHQAQGTTLAMMVAPVGILAVLEYYKKGHVNLYMAALLCLGFVFGAWGGSKLAVFLSPSVLKKVFAVVMIAIAVRILISQ